MESSPLLTVHFFKTSLGNEPVREWLKSLPLEDRKRIGEDIKTVQFGWPMGMPFVEKIDTNLWTIRTKDLSMGIARTFFTVNENYIVLLHGFIKKSQKIPLDEIKLAKRRLSLIIK
jgi:phage-related protein